MFARACFRGQGFLQPSSDRCGQAHPLWRFLLWLPHADGQFPVRCSSSGIDCRSSVAKLGLVRSANQRKVTRGSAGHGRYSRPRPTRNQQGPQVLELFQCWDSSLDLRLC